MPPKVLVINIILITLKIQKIVFLKKGEASYVVNVCLVFCLSLSSLEGFFEVRKVCIDFKFSKICFTDL